MSLQVFIDRMGFTNEETVALMGAHSLGRMDFNNSGYEGVWDQTFSKLDGRFPAPSFCQISSQPSSGVVRACIRVCERV